MGFNGDTIFKQSHQHQNYTDIHHEHHFHIGIFHFLGHLFENIGHAGDNADDHLVIIQDSSSKKVSDYKFLINKFFKLSKLVLIEIDAESLSDPPYYQIPYFQKLIRSTSPFRAPPLLV